MPIRRSTGLVTTGVLFLFTAVGTVTAFVLLCASDQVSAGANGLPTASSGIAAKTRVLQPVYPLKVGPTRRYLVDQRNAPFMIVGDSPQALTVNLSVVDAERFLADRKAAGFNAIWVNLLCTTYTGGRLDGTTYDGIQPFRIPGDLATPNTPYFSRVDAMLRLAAKYGIVVFLDPIETGGWLSRPASERC